MGKREVPQRLRAGRVRPAVARAEAASPMLQSDFRADEFLDAIENDDGSMRFVPDWSGESYRNAA